MVFKTEFVGAVFSEMLINSFFNKFFIIFGIVYLFTHAVNAFFDKITGFAAIQKIIVKKNFIKAYQKAFDEYEQELVDFCASRNVTFFSVLSNEPIEKVIFGKGYETEMIK